MDNVEVRVRTDANGFPERLTIMMVAYPNTRGVFDWEGIYNELFDRLREARNELVMFEVGEYLAEEDEKENE